MYMNGVLRSSFIISDPKLLSVDAFDNKNFLKLSFDINQEHKDIFHLLKNKIKSEKISIKSLKHKLSSPNIKFLHYAADSLILD